MNNELKKSLDNLVKTKEKNIKNIDRYKQEIDNLKNKNKKIDIEIKNLNSLAKKYSALDEQVKKVLNPQTEDIEDAHEIAS
jgi:predicted nuclease with TOPRIM domain